MLAKGVSGKLKKNRKKKKITNGVIAALLFSMNQEPISLEIVLKIDWQTLGLLVFVWLQSQNTLRS